MLVFLELDGYCVDISWFTLNLPVSIANLIAARAACRLGAQSSPSDADFPPKNEGFHIFVHVAVDPRHPCAKLREHV
jgi:hypothetical protein